MAISLTELAPGFEVYALSASEARFQYREIFELNCYDNITLGRDALVVDVGANIGLFTLYIKSAYPDSRVLAFEPMHESQQAFELNMAMHAVSGVEFEGCALGERREDIQFTYYPMLPGNSTRYPEQKALQIAVAKQKYPEAPTDEQHTGRPVHVVVDRLSARLPSNVHVDLLKVDVEGAEWDVLRGIDAADWPRIRHVVLEVQDLNGRLDGIIGMLHERGFETRTALSPMIEPEVRTYLVDAMRADPNMPRGHGWLVRQPPFVS